MTILVGDVGGTKVNLALFEEVNGEFKCLTQQKFKSSEFTTFESLLKHFIADFEGHSLKNACFGIAGPIKRGHSQLTNLSWVIDADQLKSQFQFDHVWLINDLEALAYGIAILKPEDFYVLNQGKQEEGNQAVIAAGTGLGQTGLFWDGKTHIPFPSEGGHVEFAPRNELQIHLLSYLIKRFDHVSYERVLSGRGLHHIYEFFRDTKRAEEPHWLREAMLEKDPPEVISHFALNKGPEICVESLNLFTNIYGAEAGNIALKFLSRGGLFVGGGIAPKILEKLKEKDFIYSFKAKGRMSKVLENIPVKVILNPQTPLLGSARYVTLHS